MGVPYRYKPHNAFTAMGRCWILEDEFNYLINPNLRNSAQIHNTMRAEWDWLLYEQEMFYNEIVSYKLPVPRWLATQLLRDTIDELHRALYCIREENNRIKIRLNRYRTKWRFENQWRVSSMSMHDTYNHFLQQTFISRTWRYQMKSNRVMVHSHFDV